MMVHAVVGKLPSSLTLLMSLSPLQLPKVELLLWVQALPGCLWTHFVVTHLHDANCFFFFFKQMIIETFLISQNMEKSRIRISSKYSLSYQTVPYSHHISSVYSCNT